MEEAHSESQAKYRPTITDLISLAVPKDEVQPELSPDASKVAYVVGKANWNKDQYEALCYVHDIKRGVQFQITRSGEVTQLHWIDEDSLALLKGDSTDEKIKSQVWLFENLTGEGLQVTDHQTGVKSFKPFANGILYLADNPERKENKERTDEFGSFLHFEEEESASALYYTSFSKLKEYNERFKGAREEEAKKLAKPTVELSKRLPNPLAILDFFVSPLKGAIFLNCRSKENEVYFEETSSFRLTVDPDRALEESVKREVKKGEATNRSTESGTADTSASLVSSYLGDLFQIPLPKGASIVCISPEETKLLINHKERDNMMYTQSDLWVLDLDQAEEGSPRDRQAILKKITQDLDREPESPLWVDSGVFVTYCDGTKVRIARFSETGAYEILDLNGISPWSIPHATKTGFLTFVGTGQQVFHEIFVSTHPVTSSACKLKQLTSFGKVLENWDLGSVETIVWKSRDGTEIEGVLRKPLDFDPKEKYPLVFVVHGGPASLSADVMLMNEDLRRYPTTQFVHKGILVLKPNYRGSIGRGQAFMELNKNNLGVGDLWDLESAIEYLDSKEFIDKTKVGCMGWSQGGYISAFAGIHSDKFRAVSAGAGISDWYTYHISNDIPFFTTHYLSGSPYRDRTLYTKTAPISKIQEAKTPMLIQHGELDHRVPLANATELYRGLKEMKVPVELFVYPGMGHPITKPREDRAVMHQNLTWFAHYLLGEELDFRLANSRKT